MQIAEGDRVTAHVTVRARHPGELVPIPPSRGTVRNESLVVPRRKGGRIVERWCRERIATREALRLAAGQEQADGSVDRA